MDGVQRALAIEQPDQIFQFSICTLVTDKSEYAEMLSSFEKAGFSAPLCEFLYIDNSSANRYDAYAGLNLLLQRAKGEYIILCHQDVLIVKDSKNELIGLIENLNQIDARWAVCGNAGAAGPNHIVYHISYPNGRQMTKGNFPVKVLSLDENFIILKNKWRLSFSNDLSGFHLYGTDICLNAKINGLSAYVIPFNLVHKSRGNLSTDFFSVRAAFIKKYNPFFREWVQTTVTVFYLSNSPFRFFIGNKLVLFFIRLKNSILKKIT